MIEIGQVNTLIVSRETSSGYYLKCSESGDEIFLPGSMAPLNIRLDQEIDIFAYLDSKNSLVASVDIPNAVVGEFAMMDVVEVQEFGSFFDWGIDKDLLVPGNEQKVKVKPNESHLIRVCLEEGTDRIYGTTKLGKYIEDAQFDIFDGDKVKIVPVKETDLGFKIIINRKFIGLIYRTEIFKRIVIGEEYDAYVKKVRIDGLVDCALQIQGIKNLDKSTIKIMEYLIKSGGSSELHDKSSPVAIKAQLGMSKKSFKNALGMLYKKKKIIINKDGIEINKKKK